MIDKAKIESTASAIYAKHCQRGSPAKMLAKIIKAEGIKFREVDGNEKFLGALTKGMTDLPYIIVNKNIANEGRKNFTIAHEFGHFVLGHHLQSSSFLCSESEIKEEGEVVSLQEKEANYFASCFLLPKDKVCKAFEKWFSWRFNTDDNSKKILFLFIDPYGKSYSDWKALDSKLTDRFNVSTTALKLRLVELGLINNF